MLLNKDLQKMRVVKNKKKLPFGFTLIELIVVILLVGILAAILYPMYQRTLFKSRVGSVVSVVKSVADAQEVFYMTHGRYASNRDGLTVSVPIDSEQIDLAISTEDNYKFVVASHPKVPEVRYVIFQQYSKNFPGNVHCEAQTDNKDAIWLCEEEWQGVKMEHGSLGGGNYTTYILQGSANNGSFSQNYYNASNVVVTNGGRCDSSEEGGCSNSTFIEAVCSGTSGASCQHSTFTDSECYGEGKGGKAASTICGYNTYNNSTCRNEASDGYVCGRSSYENNSACYSGSFGGCGRSEYSDNSFCYGASSTACESSTFTNSTCVAEGSGGCKAGTFTDSTCYAQSGGSSSTRSCGSGSTYNHSTCHNQSNNMYGCGSATYTNGSACHSNANGGCGGKSTFSGGSSCYGNGAGGCGGNTYTGGSVCYASVAGACNNNTYKDTSYCSGNYCPAGSPRQDGTIRTEEGA